MSNLGLRIQRNMAALLVFILFVGLLPAQGFAAERNSFKDIKGHWAEESITKVVQEGLFKGSSESVFEPQGSMTRAMFITVLNRLSEKLDGPDVVVKDQTFTDVPANAWYANAIRWAVSAGLTDGYGNGTFGPNDLLNREQITVLMIRFLTTYMGYDLSNYESSDLFADSEQISSWAKEAVYQAVALGLVQGETGNMFNPTGTASRAVVAVITERFLEKSAGLKVDKPSSKPTPTPILTPTAAPAPAPAPPALTPTPTSIPTLTAAPIPTPTPEQTPTVVVIDQVVTDAVYVVNDEKITFTGTVELTDQMQQISVISATYHSVYGPSENKIAVDGISPWSIQDIPLEIGTNHISIQVETTDGEIYNRIVIVNRVNKSIDFADNVVVLSTDNEEDINYIQAFAHSIINYWIDDMSTPNDLTDDQTVLLLNENSPWVVDLKREVFKVGDIVSISPCDEFLAGLTFMIEDFGEPSDFINYPSQDYELVYVTTPGLADLFQGDISLDLSGYIDTEDPIAFSIFPKGVELYVEDQTGEETLLVEDESRTFSLTESNYRISSQQNNPGMQWSNLTKLILPTLKVNSATSLDILMKFGDSSGVVIYDEDGNLDTKNDQVKVSGESGIKNLRTTAGIEWHPNYNPFNLDLLPQQVIFKTTYDKTVSLKAEFSAGLSLTELTKNANKALNAGFENKYQFLGMDITGIDFKDCIVLGALGIRLDMPPTYLTLGAHQTTSKAVGFSPVLLIMPVIDVTGKLEAKLALTYSYNSYVESGINIQKLGYTGSYGTLEANRGQKSVSLPFDRQLEIYDLEAKSSSKKNEEPSPSLKIEGSGSAEASFGAGIMAGLMLNGVVPAAVKGVVYARAKATLNGSALWQDGHGPTLSGSGQVGIDAGVRLNIFAKLLVKTALGNPGFDYTHDWEYRFMDYSVSSMAIKGKVSEADGDFDLSNNPSLSGVSVVAKKKYVLNSPAITATTDADGNYELSGISNGTYDVDFIKGGYITYTERGVIVSTIDKKVNVVLDKNVSCTLSGKILIADNDTNMGNNVALSGAKLMAKKVATSGSYTYHATSNASGEYQFSGLYPGMYEVSVEKSNYITIKQYIRVSGNGSTTIQNLTMEMLDVNYNPSGYNGSASGKVVNALTGYGISGITLKVRAGLNQKISTVISTIQTDSNGLYSIVLPAGNYTIEAVEKTGSNSFQTNYFNIKVVGGDTVSNQDGVMTPVIPEGQLRIILRWGETPSDLDSHLVGPKSDGSGDRFHIYFSDKQYYENNILYADLDLDDLTSWGPETTTIYKKVPGKYSFFIHDYSNRTSNSSMALADSGAYVEVYTSNSVFPLASYYVPYQEGTLWSVFEYDSETGEVSAINSMSYISTSNLNDPDNSNPPNTRTLTNIDTLKIGEKKDVEADLKLIEDSLLKEK